MKLKFLGTSLVLSLLLIGCGNTAEGMKKDSDQNSEQAAVNTQNATEDAKVTGSNIGAATMLTPKIKLALSADTLLNDKANLIDVESTDSEVTLNGHVTSEKLKSLATDIAKKVMEENKATQPLNNLLTVKQ